MKRERDALIQENEEITRIKDNLLSDIEIITQEVEFLEKDKFEHIEHYKNRCLAVEKEGKEHKERLKKEIGEIR